MLPMLTATMLMMIGRMNANVNTTKVNSSRLAFYSCRYGLPFFPVIESLLKLTTRHCLNSVHFDTHTQTYISFELE